MGIGELQWTSLLNKVYKRIIEGISSLSYRQTLQRIKLTTPLIGTYNAIINGFASYGQTMFRGDATYQAPNLRVSSHNPLTLLINRVIKYRLNLSYRNIVACNVHLRY